MMWRVLASLDFITVMEAHFGVVAPVPALGVSTGPHFAVGFWAWKFDIRCLLGPIPINTPPCLGHDAGILRPHILIDPSPMPPPPAPPATPLNSAITSGIATACSALKPTFSASRDLRNGGGALPVSTEVLPFGLGIICSGDVPCGFAGPHRGIPMVPTQLTDWTGLTLGDILGGLVNMAVQTLIQVVIERVGAAIGTGAGMVATKLGSKLVTDYVVGTVFTLLGPAILAYGPAAGLNVPGGENIGQAVQGWVDGVDPGNPLQSHAPTINVWGD